MSKFQAVDFNENVFSLIGEQWCLIGACKDNHYNMMTASWGGFGVLWNKNVATIYVRPQRYTNEFVDHSDYFTLSFFDPELKPLLGVLGSKSGRDIHKESLPELHGTIEDGMVMFEEATITIKCKKIYKDRLKSSNFMDDAIESHYPLQDYHEVYIGEILEINKR